MLIRKNILNIVEVGLILVAIYGIGIEYSGKFSTYRGDWKIFNYENSKIIVDLFVIGIFALRIFQIVRTIFVHKANEVSKQKILLISIIYYVLIAPDLYGYFIWYYYTQLTPAGLRLLLYSLPIIIWTYRLTNKQPITTLKSNSNSVH